MNLPEPTRGIKGLLSTEFVDWYTPIEVLEAARLVMGNIDLDPASCAEANQAVKADKFFTKEENGLSLPWHGRVWLNPPFGLTAAKTSSQAAWSQRLIEDYTGGKISEAILLVNASMGYHWTQPLLKYPVCFTKGRLKFRLPDNRKGQLNPVGSMLVYFGTNNYLFGKVFSQFGTICRSVDYKEV